MRILVRVRVECMRDTLESASPRSAEGVNYGAVNHLSHLAVGKSSTVVGILLPKKSMEILSSIRVECMGECVTHESLHS